MLKKKIKKRYTAKTCVLLPLGFAAFGKNPLVPHPAQRKIFTLLYVFFFKDKQSDYYLINVI